MALKSPDRLMILDNPESLPREAFNMEVDYEFLMDENVVPNIVDFTGIDRYYGSADTDGDIILLKQDAISQLRYSNENQTRWAVNFVADAWADLAAK